MDTAIKSRKSSLHNWLFGLTLFALCAGIVLSILAWMNICSETCAAGHKYRLYGIAFEPIGVLFFCITLLTFIFSRFYSELRILGSAMVFGALGAEVTFTYAQKAVIGHWCPICLSIASTVLIVVLLLIIGYIQNLYVSLTQNDKGGTMKSYFKAFGAIVMITAGFLFSHMGFAKFNQLHAVETELKDKLGFGGKDTKLEVFIFTDWKCPSCRKIEPALESALPKIMEKAKVIFVDLPIHDESLNFTPFNLSFMINNKKEYFKLRNMLEKISLKTDTPTEEEVTEGAKKLGVTYKQLNYADVASGIKYFDHLATQFDLAKTPAIVIVNSSNKKGKKLFGSEISEKAILNTLDTLKSK
ncbi:MAG: thioredoxin domain-containing protein [Parachlamydiaceae bacterium]|nr:thioredoxin domain-containing protein [Parachlamydiaceae bacterium]